MKLTAFSILVLLSVTAATARGQGAITLSCANSARDSVIDRAAAAFTKETGIKIEQKAAERRGSTATYFKDLLDGKVEAACASANYSDWVQLAGKEGVAIPPDVQISNRVVGRDLIYTIANRASGVTELTRIQLESIFTGAAKNWKLVGGADVPITIVSAKDKINTRNSFAKMVMSNKPYRSDMIELGTTNEMLAKVEKTPGAISIFSETVKAPNTVTLKTPDIGRPVTLINKGRPSESLEKFIQFIRKTNAMN